MQDYRPKKLFTTDWIIKNYTAHDEF